MYFSIKKLFLLSIIALFFSISFTKVEAHALSNEQVEFINEHVDEAILYGARYQMPWEVSITIGILETTDGSSSAAISKHNFHGITNGKGNLRRFSSDEEGWEAFYKNLVETDCYVRRNVLQYSYSPKLFLDEIVKAGYNPNPKKYLPKAESILKAVEQYRDANNLPSSYEYAQIIEQYGGLDQYEPCLDYAIFISQGGFPPQDTILIDDRENGAITISAGEATTEQLL